MVVMVLNLHWAHIPIEETQTNKLFNSTKDCTNSFIMTNALKAAKVNLTIFCGPKGFLSLILIQLKLKGIVQMPHLVL